MIEFTSPSAIKLPANRWRRTFDEEAIKELAESISNVGLINALTCRLLENGDVELVAGERRLRALKQLVLQKKPFSFGGVLCEGVVPYVSLSSITDPALLREIELDENTKRRDLTWQERVAAIAELHQIRIRQKEGWGLKDTAEELKAKGAPDAWPSAVGTAVVLAAHLDNPVVRRARTMRDALKAVAREAEAEITAFMIQKLGGSTSYLSDRFQAEKLDARDGLRRLGAGSVDVFITDPPYGIGADSMQADELTGRPVHRYKDDWKTVERLLRESIGLFSRPVKPKAHLYMFCDLLHFFELKEMCEAHKWVVWPRPLIWCKSFGHCPNAMFGPQREYECILYALRGGRPVLCHASDVILCAGVPGKEALHAAQKPTALYVNLLRRSAKPGDLIVDPFCGTGTVFEAADELSLKAVGFDDDPLCFDLSKRRIEAILAKKGVKP